MFTSNYFVLSSSSVLSDQIVLYYITNALCSALIHTYVYINSLKFLICFYILAVLLLTLLAIFPVGLDDPEVQKMCGLESHIYFTGSCKLGWSYILSAACCVASFTLPVLSHYITHVPAYNHLLPYYAN